MSLTKKAYAAIKSKIVSCEYPPDTILNESKLMTELGVSRTPIREALSKLEHEGLVRVLPKRGILVSGFSLGDIREIFQVRELLEPYIIQVWGSRMATDALEGLRARLLKSPHEVPEADLYQLDNDLHRSLYDQCENKHFVSLLDKVFDQNHRIRIQSGRIEHRLEETQAEHLLIVEKLLKGDTAEAAEAMKAHLQRSRQAAFESLMLGKS